MGVYRSTTVYCDGSESCTDAYENLGNAADVRREAKRDGWLVAQPGGKDFCPDCRKKPKAK